jgi:glycosyltransferase involved in cell wall biosynthesis
MSTVILHITNDYCGSSVYKSLFSELDKSGIEQIVYTAVRSNNLIGRNAVSFQNPSSTLFYRNILNVWDRWFYFMKIRKIYLDVLKCVNPGSLNLIHAHTWFSDGGVAYYMHRNYKFPFHVTVRSTDLFVFYTYFSFLRGFGRMILLAAESVMFVSPALLLHFKSLVGEDFYKHISNKVQIVPNGVDEFWLNNRIRHKNSLSDPIKALFVGKFIKRKNVVAVVKAVRLARQNGQRIELFLVGGGGSEHSRILNMISGLSYIKYVGRVSDLEEMKLVYRSADFLIMPSESETFGLVYIEALLQGCPVICLKEDGIDGLFEFKVGSVAKNSSAEAIYSAINELIVNYNRLKINLEVIALKHNWKTIGSMVLRIYGI